MHPKNAWSPIEVIEFGVTTCPAESGSIKHDPCDCPPTCTTATKNTNGVSQKCPLVARPTLIIPSGGRSPAAASSIVFFGGSLTGVGSGILLRWHLLGVGDDSAPCGVPVVASAV
mmetsp:Transcript_9369/g.28340  ORF Transcript_9369/g.28340 Transcript_9369/m.28340 type:complete len:115 (-) Transcript_9369:167-511(-)